jgi:hypothetical protein
MQLVRLTREIPLFDGRAVQDRPILERVSSCERPAHPISVEFGLTHPMNTETAVRIAWCKQKGPIFRKIEQNLAGLG